MRSNNRMSGIYIVEIDCAAGHWLKVGQAIDLRARLSGLQTGCPFTYSRIQIAKLHRDRLDIAEVVIQHALESRLYHGEWFSGSADSATMALIAEACIRARIELIWEILVRDRATAEQAKKRVKTLHDRAIRQAADSDYVARIEHAEESRRIPSGDVLQSIYRSWKRPK